MDKKAIEKLLLENLTDGRKESVRAKDRRLLVVAGAGSGSGRTPPTDLAGHDPDGRPR